MSGHPRPSSRNEFEIAIICALPLEANAVICSLDEYWRDAHLQYRRADGDDNSYVFGRSGNHPVVVVTLPRMGLVEASSAARSLKMGFPSINLALLVGICGAVPKTPDGTEIILGDVIISEVVVELDYGRQYDSGFRRRTHTIHDSLGRPNEEILGLLQRFKTRILLNELHECMHQHLDTLLRQDEFPSSYPLVSQDKLFASDYMHKHHSGCPDCNRSPGSVCEIALTAPCDELGCEEGKLVLRSRLCLDQPANTKRTQRIHFGSIGSSNAVMRSAKHRDTLAASEKILAFEMEGAGAWSKFNCLVVKGVSDYADSHKNKKWQDYAAAVAASVAKAILGQYVAHDRPSPPNSRFQLHSQTSNLSSGSRSGPRVFQVMDDFPSQDNFKWVLNDFGERFTMGQVESFTRTDFPALVSELKRIQDQQERSRTLRNLRRLEHFIEKSKQFGKVLCDIQEAAEPINLIWGPMKALLQIAAGHAELLDTLLSAYEKIGDEMPTFGDQYGIFIHNIALQRVLARLFADITEFHEHAMRLYSALTVVFKSLWKDFTPRFENILRRIRSHRDLIEDKVRAIYSHPEGYDVNMQEIREHLRNTEKDVLDLEEREAKDRETKFDQVRDWIAGAETETEHNNICRDRKRYPGTGDWILQNAKVKEWLCLNPEQFPSPILWINGRPGLGKSYLASMLIEECMKNCSVITCYFYCNDKAGVGPSALAVLRSILLQLVCQHSELVPYCHSKRRGSVSPNLTDISTAISLIETFCERIPHLNIIIDGLDECGEGRKDLLEILKNLIHKKSGVQSPGKIRILLLSRPMPEIKNAIPEASVLSLGPEHNKADIQAYCRRRSREFEKFQAPREIITDALDRICIRADGMFLFAKLVMDNLAKQPTWAFFQNEISAARLPTEINEAYARIMERLKRELSPGQLEFTRLLLGWLVCSKRPLKWTEIQLALSIDMDKTDNSNRINKDLKLRDDVEELCGSLVQVLKGNRIELIHSTARAFISQKSDINPAAAQCDLTLRCLRYLTLDIFKRETSDAELRNYALEGHLAFQDYAVSAWFMHFKSLVEEKEASLHEGVMPNAGESNPFLQADKISQELDNFVRFYEQDLPEVTEFGRANSDCGFFEQYPFYGDLVRIWDHICSTQRDSLETKNAVSLPSLRTAFERNRKLLESLSQDPSVDFHSLYDEYPFRCSKLTCFFFHEGFKSDTARKEHVDYHDRPIRCPVESCDRYTFGFRSNNERNYHVKRYHPEEHDFGETFTDLNQRQVVSSSKWQCSECHKCFKRRNILRDHERAHRDERPFACPECGRAFVRSSDLTRHQKKVHEKRGE
ncbi:hypothetical protein BJX61DRAFT_530663 [Aspergillus egyptiacus]|nr:hypothetical protein BJX61DRAFT_530663 [Aspergillus egyptiacus]